MRPRRETRPFLIKDEATELGICWTIRRPPPAYEMLTASLRFKLLKERWYCSSRMCVRLSQAVVLGGFVSSGLALFCWDFVLFTQTGYKIETRNGGVSFYYTPPTYNGYTTHSTTLSIMPKIQTGDLWKKNEHTKGELHGVHKEKCYSRKIVSGGMLLGLVLYCVGSLDAQMVYVKSRDDVIPG